MVAEAGGDLWDSASRSMVPPGAVLAALARLAPQAFAPGGELLTVYHATSEQAARVLLGRGFTPETKPRGLAGSYAPGQGLDAGLYVGASPRAVEGYGRAVLAVTVPRSALAVPTELAQLGERDPMAALRSHDGAVILARVPAEAFRRVE